MQFQELSEFIDWTLSDLGKGTFPRDPDMTKRIFAQTIKLAEEVGELSSEVLGKTCQILRRNAQGGICRCYSCHSSLSEAHGNGYRVCIERQDGKNQNKT